MAFHLHVRVSVVFILLVFKPPLVSSFYKSFLKQFDVKPLSNNDEMAEKCLTEYSSITECVYPTDCSEVQKCGRNKTGVYRIFPFGVGKGFPVYCNMVTDGGGWLVFQRRQDGSVDFYRNWKNYTDGFGNLFGEFWLGLEKTHLITSQRDYELRVDLKSYDKGTGFAVYDRFRLSDGSEKYKLFLGKYSGDGGDSMASHNGCKFSTLDEDNDHHTTMDCAERGHGAWWYNKCDDSNLNGQYFDVNKKDETGGQTVNWHHLAKKDVPLQSTEMKIRPIGNL